MTALISIAPSNIGEATIQTVNARDLHAFLESKRQFADWIKERIQQYDFVENQDFVLASQNCEARHGGHNRKEYHLSLSMAKELSMVERNAKGKQARQYFIECERQAKEAALVLDPRNLSRMQLMQIAMDAERERLALEHQVAEQAPKVEVYDRISEDAGTYLIRRAAKVLGVGPGKFVDWMLNHGWAYRHANKGQLLGYQDKLDRGWLAHKLTPFWNRRTQTNEVTAALRVTSAGMNVLAKKVPAIAAA